MMKTNPLSILTYKCQLCHVQKRCRKYCHHIPTLLTAGMPLALALILLEVAPVRLSAGAGTRRGRGSDCVVVAACGGFGLISDCGSCQHVIVMSFTLVHVALCQWKDRYQGINFSTHLGGCC